MADVDELTPGTLFAGDFRIERPIRRGGMGAVYAATQVSTGRQRALKLMLPGLAEDADAQRRFTQEARIAARIESAHVVQVIGAGIERDVPWLAMELLEGEDLSRRLKRGPLPPAEAAEVFAQLTHALAAAHAVQVVHRDLKPSNVFLERSRVEGARVMLKVLDFGIAKLLEESASRTTQPVGTPLYMAPEQASAEPVTPATDVWALGLITFEILVGRSYWRCASGPSAAIAVLREATVDPIDPASARATSFGLGGRLPDGFDAWFARCVARPPGDRFPDAGAARAALLPILRAAAAADPALAETASVTPSSPGPVGAVDLAPGQTLSEAVSPPGARHVGASATRRSSRARLVGVALMVLVAAAAVLATLRRSSGTDSAPPARAAGAPGAASGASPSNAATGGPKTSIDDAFNFEYPALYRVPVGDSPARGPADAEVTLVMFADFECPYSKLASTSVSKLQQKYGTRMRVVWKDFPFGMHPNAHATATFAREALRQQGPAGFWKAHDKLFAIQPALDRLHLETAARELGLDVAEVRRALDGDLHRGAIEADIDLADALLVAGIPQSFINGHPVTGADEDGLAKAVAEQLLLAQQALARGVPRAELYATLIRDGVRERARPLVTPPRREKDNLWTGSSADDALEVHEFCDYEEPFCVWMEPNARGILRRHPEVRLVWWDAPKPPHERGRRAAMATHAVNTRAQGWKMHDLMLDALRVPGWGTADPSVLELPSLRRFADQVGADLNLFDYNMRMGSADASILREREVAKQLGITDTAFLIGGYFYGGSEPPHSFDRAIERALAARAAK